MPLDCKELNLAFLESEQKVSEGLIKKKLVAKNAYYGKIPDDKKFPLRSGTRIKGQRLGRIVPPNCLEWEPVSDALCETNACDNTEKGIISNGNSEFFYSLVKNSVRTDWLCLDSLALREEPEAEVAHLEDGLAGANRYLQEEFRRSRFLSFARNKMVSILAEDGNTGLPTAESITSCEGAEQLNNGYVFETRPNGEMDECHIRVCVNPGKPGLIGGLSLDNLDYASLRLSYEDEAYLPDTMLFDVLTAHQQLANQLALQEDDKLHNAAAYGNYDMVDLGQRFGSEKVLRNYSLRTDLHAMRFYPDVEFNDALLAQQGYAFDTNDPNTWCRMVRVFPYRMTKAGLAGVDHLVAENYLRAPFGITTILNPRVMSVMPFPETGGFGSATKEGNRISYDGAARWINPDWPCNVDRNKGFWKLNFRMAAKQEMDEEGYSWLHRLNNKVDLVGSRCALPEAAQYSEVTPYCYEGMGATEEDDEGVGGNRATND